MFGLFKRKEKKTDSEKELVDYEPIKERDNGAAKIATGHVIDTSVRASSAQAKIKYTKPAYNPQSRREYYDDPKAHSAAIERAFSSGDTVRDPYTGAELVQKQRDAKIKFGTKWQDHAAEADHIDPLSQIAKRNEKNPFLTTDDIREIGNADDNFQVMSRKLNQTSKTTGKGGSTQQEWAEDSLRMEGVAEIIESGESIDTVSNQIKNTGKAAEKRNDKRVLRRSTKNAMSAAHEAGKAAAKNAGITTATMSGILNITAVIKGEKTVGEALADTVVDTGKAAVTGYAMGGGLTTLSQSLSGSSSFIQGLVESNVPGKVITAVIVTGDTLKRYGNGEISTEECLLELGEKGLGMLTSGYSMMIGQALIPIPVVGGAVGALVGSVLTSKYYQELVMQLKTREFEHKERLRIIAECERAAEEARRYREELSQYLNEYFTDYQDCFDNALGIIRESFRTGDADGVIEGANEITRKLGGRVYYNNVDEYSEFLLSGNIFVL